MPIAAFTHTNLSVKMLRSIINTMSYLTTISHLQAGQVPQPGLTQTDGEPEKHYASEAISRMGKNNN